MYYSKKNYEDLKEMIINNPAYIGIIFSNTDNYNDIKYENSLGNNIMHLISRYHPVYLYTVFISNSFQPDIEKHFLYLKSNFFGMTWLYTLCMYSIDHYKIIEDFISHSLMVKQDIIGNTIFHIIARFNPSYILDILKNRNIKYCKYSQTINMDILYKRDILGNTFLHTLCIYHPDIYLDISNNFENDLKNIKNKFGKKCYQYINDN